MSKEEILGETGMAFEYSPSLEVVPVLTVLEAMDTFAKQEVIGFAKWLHQLRFYLKEGSLNEWYDLSHKGFFTTEELHELYLKSKQ